MIDKWRRLERVTVKRQDQSKQLFEMYKQIMGADACIDRCRDNLSVKTFGDPSELEAAIKAVLVSGAQCTVGGTLNFCFRKPVSESCAGLDNFIQWENCCDLCHYLDKSQTNSQCLVISMIKHCLH